MKNNVINLFDFTENDNSDDQNSEPNLISKLIHIKSSNSLLRLKVFHKINALANVKVLYTENPEEINEEDYIVFGSNFSEREIDKLNIIRSYKDDLKTIVYEPDRLSNSQQTSMEVLELLFFKANY